MEKIIKRLLSIILTISILVVFLCPQFAFADASDATVVIDEFEGTVQIAGIVEDYTSSQKEAYIVVPAKNKSYDDFAKATTYEEINEAVAYIGYVTLATGGAYSKTFSAPGIPANHPVYLSYNGVVTNINTNNTGSSTTIPKKLNINGSVDYVKGVDTVEIAILKAGCTYDDYVSEGDAAEAVPTTEVPVDSEGKYEFSASNVTDIASTSKVVIIYNGITTVRTLQMHEFVAQFYVDSESGSDSNDGSDVSKAFKTIDKAESEYSALKSKGFSGEIVLCPGTYSSIPAKVSPIGDARLTYVGLGNVEDVVVKNTTDIPLSDFEVVTDKAILNRLDRNARGYVYQVDLGKRGLTRADILGSAADGWRYSFEIYMAQAYLDGVPQTIARWPNDGYLQTNFAQTSGTTTVAGNELNHYTVTNSEIANWTFDANTDMYMEGFFNTSKDWVRDQAIVKGIGSQVLTFTQPYYMGVGSQELGASGSYGRVAFHNFLEGIDMPGEWYVDTNTMIMYYYMPDNTDADVLELNTSRTSVVNVTSSLSNVTFKNLTFRGAGSYSASAFNNVKGALYFKKADNVHIEECVIEASRFGVIIDDGRHNVIENNSMRYVLGNAVWIKDGGDPATLAESANVIANNHFYHCATAGTHGLTGYETVIRVTGHIGNLIPNRIGEIIENNVVHASPFAEAVMYNGLEVQIRYNEFYNLIRYMGDAGVIYSGARLNTAGNKIEYNYFHDISNTLKSEGASTNAAIYFDDLQSGQTVNNNIFVDTGANTRALMTFGRDVVARNNVVYGMESGIVFSDRGVSNLSTATGNYKSAHNSLSTTNLTDAMKAKYPTLAASYTELYNTGAAFVPKNLESEGNMQVSVSNTDSASGTSFTKLANNLKIYPSRTSDRVYSSGSGSGKYWTTSTKLGVNQIFTDMANHNYTISNTFKNNSAFSSYFPADFELTQSFAIDSIGLVGNFWDNSAEDKNFSLTYPVNRQIEAADGTATLSWTKALYADRYQYAVYSNSNLSASSLVDSGEVNAYHNAATISGLQNGQKYYWVVTAINDSKEMGGEWSSINTGYFTVGTPDYALENVSLLDADNQEITDMANIANAKYITFDIINNTSASATYDLIVALYDAQGEQMKQVLLHAEALTAAKGTTSAKVEIASIQNYTAGDQIYVFTWKPNGSIEPLAKKVIIK